ncbi:FecCD family ABC transporter permease [Paracoccus sulfuroxidans]|uniref:Iron complex transport system permease protein n=1 Tax=Paracoccus sulfuroxidans TaxID=384678 RepID=A0A562NP06_9RHOB|nr:iron ABC transporter permease [Paracoccus sulfuroxidans]TWI33922.1 iron complex transport system permease protein [Paracoccus sulfuroxidans]
MPRSPILPLLILWCLVTLAFAAALALGAQDIAPGQVMGAIMGDRGPAADVVLGLRLPRAAAAVFVGGALAVAGVVMQTLARNPLADPSLTGVNAGAALAVVLGLMSFGVMPRPLVAALAFGGAAAAAIIVRLLAGHGDTTLRLPLAGAAFASICMSIVALVVLLNPEARNIYRFWMVGSLAMADLQGLAMLVPVGLLGVLCALFAARGIEALMLSDELGAALGVSPGQVLTLALLAIALTAGASVALAGPVGFIGLIAPHIARRIVGSGLSRLILASVPLGAILALVADVIGRVAIRPSELPIGIVLAIFGAPAFMLFARQLVRGPK